MAYTLNCSGRDFEQRRFITATDTAELKEKLRSGSHQANTLREMPADLVFMFPGQGSQYVTMGAELYHQEPLFRKAVDDCAAILQSLLDADIRDILYPGGTATNTDTRINNTFYTQPAIFVIEYALATLWMSWGITPSAFVGHSIGEFVAAHLAGVFSLEDALLLVASRGRL